VEAVQQSCFLTGELFSVLAGLFSSLADWGGAEEGAGRRELTDAFVSSSSSFATSGGTLGWSVRFELHNQKLTVCSVETG
jgi:hypothetical protein